MLISRDEMTDIDLVPNEIRDKILHDTKNNKILEELSKVIKDREEER